MLRDRYGLELTTTSSAARDAYVRGVDLLLSANAGAEEALRDAIGLDPAFAAAHIALARTFQVYAKGGEARAAASMARREAERTSPRERAHVAILADVVDGKGSATLAATTAHLAEYPRDCMVLAPWTGVFGLIGFSGRSGRERALRNFLDPFAAAYGDDWWYRSAQAFAQIETGDVALGLANVERSLTLNPRNANGAHVRSHAYYEHGEAAAGLDYLATWLADYEKSAALHCHLSWHVAIWALELGQTERAFDVYRHALHPGPSWGPPINTLTDAASFLFRAELAGVPRNDDLWRDVSKYAVQHFPEPGIAFVDVHSAVAHAMAGESEALSRIQSTTKGPAADVVAPLAGAFQAIAAGAWGDAVANLQSVLAAHERIGGSRAQRDLIEYALTQALLRCGRANEARALLTSRRPLIHGGGIGGA
jgi:tetratricopeptide (TPR) repeat protein